MATGKLSNTIFYSISNGKIVRQFPSATSQSTERINKNGKTIHEEFYDFIDGRISDIGIKEHAEYGKFWAVILKDDSGVVQNLQFNYSSGYAAAFLKALPNVDLTQKVKLIPNAKKVNDKLKATIFIKQNDKSIKWYFTKDNPNGLPPLKKIKIKGKETWDDTEVMEFLEAMVVNDVLPKLSDPQALTALVTEMVDDMPF